jgi:hypothetical protein
MCLDCKDVNWNSTYEGKTMKFIIPVNTKKWYQFWKKSDLKRAEEALLKLREQYDTGVEFADRDFKI